MLRAEFPHNKERKRTEAKARQEAYNKLSPAQKLAALDEKFGENKGAIKQRLKLHQPQAAVVIHGGNTVAEPAEPKQRQRRQHRVR